MIYPEVDNTGREKRAADGFDQAGVADERIPGGQFFGRQLIPVMPCFTKDDVFDALLLIPGDVAEDGKLAGDVPALAVEVGGKVIYGDGAAVGNVGLDPVLGAGAHVFGLEAAVDEGAADEEEEEEREGDNA